MSPVSVLLCDDHPLTRMSLRTLFEVNAGFTVVGEAEDGAAAVELARRLRPDVVLIDIRMPVLDGLGALRALSNLTPDVAVIVLTTFDDDSYVHQAVRAGARGFLLKTSAPEQMLEAVRAVARGGSTVDPSVTRRLLDELATALPADAAPLLARVTAREVDVLRLVASGRPNDEIARETYLSPATVRTYVSRLLRKLAVRDRAQLALLARDHGLTNR